MGFEGALLDGLLVVDRSMGAPTRERLCNPATFRAIGSGFSKIDRSGQSPRAFPPDQDSKPSGRYCPTFSLVIVSDVSVIDCGTWFSTRSLMPLP
jgi:hypothetical protein